MTSLGKYRVTDRQRNRKLSTQDDRSSLLRESSRRADDRGAGYPVGPVWIEGCSEWIQVGIENGWTAYYVNIMFQPLPGTVPGIISQMHRIIRREFYSRLCTRFVHDTRSEREQERMPRLWLFPDKPVLKWKRHSLRSVLVNHGIHFNGPMLIPPVSRFHGCPIDLIDEIQSMHTRPGIERIHVTEIDRTVGRLASYAAKTVEYGRADPEDILILPVSPSELPTVPKIGDPTSRAIKEIQARFHFSDELARRYAISGKTRSEIPL